MMESIFLWPYLGLTCMIIMWCSVNWGWWGRYKRLQAQTTAYQNKLGVAERNNKRLFELAHGLIRSFQLRPFDNPYIVERMDGNSINDQFVVCFHCKRDRQRGHAENCIWNFVNQRIMYDADGTIHLKQST